MHKNHPLNPERLAEVKDKAMVYSSERKPPTIPDDVYAWLMHITEPAAPTDAGSLSHYGWQECLRSLRLKINAAKNKTC